MLTELTLKTTTGKVEDNSLFWLSLQNMMKKEGLAQQMYVLRVLEDMN